MQPRAGAIAATLAVIAGLVALGGCASVLSRDPGSGSRQTLRIAATTSLDDSGLLAAILPDFEEQAGVTVHVIAVGTGQAIGFGERGDVDLIFVHAPHLEAAFVEQGYGVERVTIMTNPYIIVGPKSDPAGVERASDAADALLRIADAEAVFVSRGDDSGTHVRETQTWDEANFEPSSDLDWYYAAGQGMGETLLTAHELEAYALTDRATFVTMRERLPDLVPLYGDPLGIGAGDPLLENPYSAIEVSSERHPEVNAELARSFIDWLDSEPTRERIARFGREEYGESLFTLLDERPDDT
jgi:tungstate transport system substrate-binding protein